MSESAFRLLSEGFVTNSIIDDPVFTEITDDGEVYTLYQIIRITHEAENHPENWTHRANVAQVRHPRIGVALLQVVDRVIVRSRVTLSPITE